jgi:hypothetical protein
MIRHMAPSSESNASEQWDASDIREVRAEALDVLSDTVLWQLAETRWQEIGQILGAIAAALDSGDMDALAAATADLELAGPLRITPIGPAVGPSQAVHDLVGDLVHSLGGVTAAQPTQEPGDAGAANASAPRR